MEQKPTVSSTNQQELEQKKFERLEELLEAFIENARQLCIVASNFQQGGQPILQQKIYTMVSGLQDLDRAKLQFGHVKIPLELCQFIDDGKNPHLYTKQCLENTRGKNEEINGKIELYTKFRACLMKELQDQFPNEIRQYKILRKEENY